MSPCSYPTSQLPAIPMAIPMGCPSLPVTSYSYGYSYGGAPASLPGRNPSCVEPRSSPHQVSPQFCLWRASPLVGSLLGSKSACGELPGQQFCVGGASWAANLLVGGLPGRISACDEPPGQQFCFWGASRAPRSHDRKRSLAGRPGSHDRERSLAGRPGSALWGASWAAILLVASLLGSNSAYGLSFCTFLAVSALS